MTLSGSPFLAAFERGQALRQRQTLLQPITGQQTNEPTPQTNSTSSQTTPNTAAQSDPNQSVAPKRSVPFVHTIAQRAQITNLMLSTAENDRDKHIPSKAVAAFPHLFRGNANANISKASRLWKRRLVFFKNLDAKVNPTIRRSNSFMTSRFSRGRIRVDLKAREGRGRKRSAWATALHRDWIAEFERLRKLGVKFNYKNLRSLGQHVLENSTSDEYGAGMIDPSSNKPLRLLPTARFTQSFADRLGIVSRAHTGKRKLSTAKTVFIEKQVAYHLGLLARGFRSGQLQEDDIENADEAHFVIDVDNSRTLGFAGEEEVKYAEAVSDGVGMTMVVRISAATTVYGF